MKRYIYNIQYNAGDKELDKVFIDAYNKESALKKLRAQFPGVYSITFIRIEKEL